MTKTQQINLMFYSQIIIMACFNMSDPYWPLIIHRLDDKIPSDHLQYWSAAIYIIPFLITILTTPMWSYLGDRIGHKKMLLRASFALAGTQLLIGFATDPLLIVGIRLLQGVFAGFTAAAQAWSIIMADPKSHSYVMGRMQGATAIGTIVGPLVGGLIANYLGYSSIFFLSAAICTATVMVMMICLQETECSQSLKKSRSLRELFHLQNNVLYLLGLICLTQTARWMNSSFFALYAFDQLSGDNLTVGILYSIIALAIFLSAPKWGHYIDKSYRTRNIKMILMVTLIISALSQWLFAFSQGLILALFSALLWGISLGAIALIPFTLLLKEANANNKGSLIGFGNSATKMGNMMGVALGTLIKANVDYTYTFIAIGLFYCSLAGVLFFNPLGESDNIKNVSDAMDA